MSVSVAEELLALADKAATAVACIGEPTVKATLAALAGASEEIGRAWSESNVGYHATVYCKGFVPRPAHVQFSSEWGLMSEWPSHEPNPIWEVFEHQKVVDEVLRRAGAPNFETLNDTLKPLRNSFLELKEEAISLLMAALTTSDDKFIQRKLQQVEKLGAPSVTRFSSTAACRRRYGHATPSPPQEALNPHRTNALQRFPVRRASSKAPLTSSKDRAARRLRTCAGWRAAKQR